MTPNPLREGPTRRKYKSGTSFCLWRWTDVDSEYITRLHVIKTPWWAICVHWINKPDPEPFLHDHPVTFLSIILRGGYVEERNDSFYARTRFNYVRATDRHTIKHVGRGGCVTLCFMGPKRRDWGFHTPAGWIMWKDYYASQRSEANGVKVVTDYGNFHVHVGHVGGRISSVTASCQGRLENSTVDNLIKQLFEAATQEVTDIRHQWDHP